MEILSCITISVQTANAVLSLAFSAINSRQLFEEVRPRLKRNSNCELHSPRESTCHFHQSILRFAHSTPPQIKIGGDMRPWFYLGHELIIFKMHSCPQQLYIFSEDKDPQSDYNTGWSTSRFTVVHMENNTMFNK